MDSVGVFLKPYGYVVMEVVLPVLACVGSFLEVCGHFIL